MNSRPVEVDGSRVNVSATSPTQVALNASFARAQGRSEQAVAELLTAAQDGGDVTDPTELVKQVLAVKESQVAVLALASVERAQNENTKSLLDILA